MRSPRSSALWPPVDVQHPRTAASQKVSLAPRPAAAGSGWQTDTDGLRLAVHERGQGPGDTASLPYFSVADLATTLERVRELGGSIIHPGDRWAVCRDSEGSPFALAAAPAPGE
jgi:hypothetical protein